MGYFKRNKVKAFFYIYGATLPSANLLVYRREYALWLPAGVR